MWSNLRHIFFLLIYFSKYYVCCDDKFDALRIVDFMNLDDKWNLFIEKHTKISRNHTTPEIQLRLFPQDSSFGPGKTLRFPYDEPYWGFYWPGGQVLSRYILDNADTVKNLSVLDVGCGCGATSIAAVMSKARLVFANDIDNVALIATKINARLNEVKLNVTSQNLVGMNIVQYDCFLIGDMFLFGNEFATKLFDWLYWLKKSGKTVLLGDPGRPAFKTELIQKHLTVLASYELPYPQNATGNGTDLSASVYTIKL